MSATHECVCGCVCMYVRAGGACADVRVLVYLVVHVYYMTPFDVVQFVHSLNITVIIAKSVFLYYNLLGVFYHSVLCVDPPLPFVVYASYSVCLTVMLRRAARMSSWAIPFGRPSLGRRLSYRRGVSFRTDSRSPVRFYPPPRVCYVLTVGRLYGLT